MEIDALYQELEHLRQDIHFHNYRYHVLDAPSNGRIQHR